LTATALSFELAAMEPSQVISCLSALAQPARLRAVTLLLSEPDGLPAGEIARRLEVAQNTMSAHLKTLASAGLITGNRTGKVIAYKVDPDLISRLGTFLTSLGDQK
jgi:ArsR family transcriptional regulator